MGASICYVKDPFRCRSATPSRLRPGQKWIYCPSAPGSGDGDTWEPPADEGGSSSGSGDGDSWEPPADEGGPSSGSGDGDSWEPPADEGGSYSDENESKDK